MGAKIEDHRWDVTQYTAIKNKALLVQPDRYRQLLDAEKELAERDKLIEQMREALIVADSLVASLIDTHVDRCASVYDFDRNIIKAALSAAERVDK